MTSRKGTKSNDDIMAHLNENTPLNQVRAVFSGRASGIEQDALQRRPAGPIEVRGMELEAVQQILDKAVEVGLVAYVPAKGAST